MLIISLDLKRSWRIIVLIWRKSKKSWNKKMLNFTRENIQTKRKALFCFSSSFYDWWRTNEQRLTKNINRKFQVHRMIMKFTVFKRQNSAFSMQRLFEFVICFAFFKYYFFEWNDCWISNDETNIWRLIS